MFSKKYMASISHVAMPNLLLLTNEKKSVSLNSSSPIALYKLNSVT